MLIILILWSDFSVFKYVYSPKSLPDRRSFLMVKFSSKIVKISGQFNGSYRRQVTVIKI